MEKGRIVEVELSPLPPTQPRVLTRLVYLYSCRLQLCRNLVWYSIAEDLCETLTVLYKIR